MHPVVFSINQFEVFGRTFGPMYIYSYGVFLAIAFMAGMFLLMRDGKKLGIKPEDVMDVMIYVIIASIVGARLMYIILQPAEYANNPMGALKIYQGGLSFHGGAIGGIAAIYFFTWRRGIKFAFFADACVRPLVLGAAITRLGCFFNGCCYGHECSLPWAVVFPVLHDNIPRHPTQFYDLILHLVLFGVVTYAARYKRKDGDVSAVYFMGFAVLRFIVEFARIGATAREFAFGLTEAQVASFGIFALGLILYMYKGRGDALPVSTIENKKPQSSGKQSSGAGKSKKNKKKT